MISLLDVDTHVLFLQWAPSTIKMKLLCLVPFPTLGLTFVPHLSLLSFYLTPEYWTPELTVTMFPICSNASASCCANSLSWLSRPSKFWSLLTFPPSLSLSGRRSLTLDTIHPLIGRSLQVVILVPRVSLLVTVCAFGGSDIMLWSGLCPSDEN